MPMFQKPLQYCLRILISLPLLASAHLPTHSLPSPTNTAPLIIPKPPALASKSYILMDYQSGHVLVEQAADQPAELASLTKMMTAYAVNHAIKNKQTRLTDTVRVSENAWRRMGSRMFLELNSEPTVEELLKGIIVQSGNDASVAIAEHIAGSEQAFAELMNFYAKQLGMTHTHFVNATGLPDPQHISTARDLALLSKALIRDFPESYQLYSQKEFIYRNIKQPNRNRLLWRNSAVDGIKTGHTESAGYCLAASGQKEGMRLIAVLMGANTDALRTEETNKLLSYGFRFFETRKLYSARTALQTARIWMGTEKMITLGLADDLYITLGQGQSDRLKATLDVRHPLKAPLNEGTAIGTLIVELDGKAIAERPIVALNTIPSAGIFSRLYDSILLVLQNLWKKITS